eukprot:g16376.t1
MEDSSFSLIVTPEEEPFVAKWDKVALEQTVRNILRQVEYYFSNQNLWQDEVLHGIIRQSKEGWVPLAYVASLERIHVITTDPRLLILTLRQSRKVEMNETCTAVRRVTPLPSKNPRMVAMRTIYVDRLPAGSTIKTIRKRFAKFGRVLYVTKCSRIGEPNPINAHDSLPVDPNSEVRTCLIEYAKLEGAKKAVTMIQSFNQKRSKLFQLMHGQGSVLQGSFENEEEMVKEGVRSPRSDREAGKEVVRSPREKGGLEGGKSPLSPLDVSRKENEDSVQKAEKDSENEAPKTLMSPREADEDESSVLFQKELGGEALIEYLTQLVIRDEIKEGMKLAKQLQHTQKEINMLDYVGVHVLTKFSYLRKIGQMPKEFESPVPPGNEDLPGRPASALRRSTPKTPNHRTDQHSWTTPRNSNRYSDRYGDDGLKWDGSRPNSSSKPHPDSSGKKAFRRAPNTCSYLLRVPLLRPGDPPSPTLGVQTSGDQPADRGSHQEGVHHVRPAAALRKRTAGSVVSNPRPGPPSNGA